MPDWESWSHTRRSSATGMMGAPPALGGEPVQLYPSTPSPRVDPGGGSSCESSPSICHPRSRAVPAFGATVKLGHDHAEQLRRAHGSQSVRKCVGVGVPLPAITLGWQRDVQGSTAAGALPRGDGVGVPRAQQGSVTPTASPLSAVGRPTRAPGTPTAASWCVWLVAAVVARVKSGVCSAARPGL